MSPTKKPSIYVTYITNLTRDRTLLAATLLALIIHGAVIFGIGFTISQDPAALVQDVAQVLSEDMQPNPDAKYIANASQVGGGEVRQQLRQESVQISPMTDVQMQDTQDIINLEQQVPQQQFQESYLQTTLSWRQSSSKNDNDSEQSNHDFQVQEARLRKQIATLEAQLSQRQQEFATKSKVLTVDSNSTTKGEAVDYIERFRHQVEQIGNQQYPEQARRQNITGEVRLMVIIRPDGSVKDIRLLGKSGSNMLDDAAKTSVKRAAPFGRFSKDMQDITELRLIRTFRYSDRIEVTY